MSSNNLGSVLSKVQGHCQLTWPRMNLAKVLRRHSINLLTLTVLCEKRSCLIGSKKKKQNKIKKRIKKLIKMIMEAIIVIIIITTMKTGNKSKSGQVEKNQNKQ